MSLVNNSDALHIAEVDKGQEQPSNVAIVKKRKGRPPKEQKHEDIKPEEKQQKKRGRKPKAEVKPDVDAEPKQKKKRGRKAAVKFFSSSIRKKIPLTTTISDSNNYILHLDVQDEGDVVGSNITYAGVSADNTVRVDGEDNINDVMIENVCYETKKETYSISDVRKGLADLLDNDKNILSDFIDNQNAYDSKELRELYENRIRSRESQDKNLVHELELLHRDEDFMTTLLQNPGKNTEQTQSTKIDDRQALNRRKGYFEVLHKFIHNTEWIERTDVCCWWCCHQFDTVPVGMPVDYDAKVKKYRVKGVYCGFPCMMAHSLQEPKMAKKNYMIKYLHTKMTGMPIETVIDVAPPRCALKMFGGELSIEEFRQSSKHEKVYKMVNYPMFISRDYIEEIDIADVKKANTKVFDAASLTRVVNLDDKRVQDAKLRLSNDKTIITPGNTLDKFIMIS